MPEKIKVPPGFTKPLGSIDDTFMQDHDSKAGEMITFPGSVDELSGKKRSLRERTSRNLLDPTHFRPCQRGQGLQRRGSGRSSKQISHVPASQPLQRGPGRPRKKRSDESPALQPLQRVRGRPRKEKSDEAPAVSPPAPPLESTGDVPIQVSATTIAAEPVAPSLGPPLGSSSDRPLEVPFTREEEEREKKLKLNPLLKLKKPPKTNHTLQMLDEEWKKVILKVEYLLVQKLLTSGNDDIDRMVHQANTTFTYFKGFGVDYGSFYKDVTEYIEHCYNFHDAEREETMLSFSVWGGNYLNAMRSVNDAEEVIVRTQGEHKKIKERMETLKRQIEDMKQELAHIKHEDERLKRDIIKYKEAHEVAEAKKQELGIQLEAAQAKLREIKQRKNAALIGIESTTRRLESTYVDDLD
ncbi:hypothetical protein HAX54_030983 [Datura stramonium]|uniref:Uncharacterized protein n=1 Tax=Datura stramonium TaxID=4076 RepID=A0ABS8V9R6_DATST|nr:hypothetical protein [Datura stramonium]